nr:hypothetical protein [uncultured Agathobaculum sp.]
MRPHDKPGTARYDDLLALPHPEPAAGRARMPRCARAAQFAPFAALTGHDEAIRETARTTDPSAALDEHEQAVLDRRLQLLRRHLAERPTVSLTYFLPDAHKPGGAYHTACGQVVQIDTQTGLLLADRTRIPIENLRCVEGALFSDWE